MHSLTPLSPLGEHEPKVDYFGSMTLSEVTSRAVASYCARKGCEKKARGVLSKYIDNKIPDVSQLIQGDVSAFWVGPEQWFVVAPIKSYENMPEDLAAKAKDVASVTEQTDAWCHFDLLGPKIPEVMERLCNLDLIAKPIGSANRCQIDHLGCFVIYWEIDIITIMGPRSAAESLHHAINSALQSVF